MSLCLFALCFPLVFTCLSQSSAFPCLACAFPSVPLHPSTPPYYCMRGSDAFPFQILPFVPLTYFVHLWVSLRAFPTLFAPPSLVSPACLKYLSFNYQLPVSGLALWIKFDCLQLWTPFATLWFRIMYLLCCFWLLPSEYMWVCECMWFFSLLPSRCACVCWLRQVTAEWLIWIDSRAWIGWLDGQQPLNQQLTATSLLSWSKPTTSRHVAISSVCFCVRNLESNSLVNSPS